MRDLTADEQAVLDKLADAFIASRALPVVHHSDNAEIIQAIHVAQNIIMARPAVEEELRRRSA